MSLLCFSMDFALTEAEIERTAVVTSAAYDAWVLVNDYFSWEKEWKNFQDNGSKGEIVSAVFLFMKWNSVDWQQGKAMLRKEILSREEMYCQAKEDFLARGNLTEKTIQWLELLDLVTAGNFAWSMTTARYDLQGEDSYPRLRAEEQDKQASGFLDTLSTPISVKVSASLGTQSKSEDTTSSRSSRSTSVGANTTAPTTPDDSGADALKVIDIKTPATLPVPSLKLYEEVSENTSVNDQ